MEIGSSISTKGSKPNEFSKKTKTRGENGHSG